MRATWLDDGSTIPVDVLRAEGVPYERLDLSDDAYLPALERVKGERGYVEQDQVALTPDTPGLDALCAKFVDEHLHDDDEVRFVLAGRGILDIRSADDRWMRVEVDPGDLIVVPAGRYHRFLLTDEKTIRCVRLFQDASGWVPHYRAQPTEPAREGSGARG